VQVKSTGLTVNVLKILNIGQATIQAVDVCPSLGNSPEPLILLLDYNHLEQLYSYGFTGEHGTCEAVYPVRSGKLRNVENFHQGSILFPYMRVYSYSLLSLLMYSISLFHAKLCRIVPIGGDGGDFIHHPNRRSHKKKFFFWK
jgi:hypothetical protein